MAAPTEDERRIIDDAVEKIINSFDSVLVELWDLWCDLGLNHETIFNRVHFMALVDRFWICLNKTREIINELNSDIEKLKLEIFELCQYLSIDISLPEYSKGMILTDYKMELESIAIGLREQVNSIARTRNNRIKYI